MGFPGAVGAHSPITAPNLGQAWTSTDVKARLAPFTRAGLPCSTTLTPLRQSADSVRGMPMHRAC